MTQPEELNAAVLQASPAESSPIRTSRGLDYLRLSTSRKASKNGEAEGYSILQQREYCYRKADQLDVTVPRSWSM